MSRQIRTECERWNLQLYPECVQREENTVADRLSKAWEDWFRLRHAYGRDVAEWVQQFDRYKRVHVMNVPFNQIRNALRNARE